MTDEKLRRGAVDDMYAVRNKLFRGKMWELIRCFISEDRPGIFRVYLCVDGERTAESPEFTNLAMAQKAQEKFIKKITLETWMEEGDG